MEDVVRYSSDAVEALTRINLEDALAAFGLEKMRRGRWLAEWPFRSTARKFARLMLAYDQEVATWGLQAASTAFLQRLSAGLECKGQGGIPAEGPLLILSNHPGMTDTLALFASLARPDLVIVAAERPFLQALPAVARQLISVPDESEGRLSALRAVASHLRRGGSVLTFPAGQIEPDPQVLPGAVKSLERWSASIGLFVRLNPETHILPVVVSGVLAPQATFHPLTRLRRSQLDRERLGAGLQLIAMVQFPHLWPVRVRVEFAPPIPAAELIPKHDPAAITAAVLERLRPFMIRVANPQG